jgi:hypothetical protein
MLEIPSDGVGVGLGVGFGVAVGAIVGLGVGVAVGSAVGVAVGAIVGFGVGVGILVGVGAIVGVGFLLFDVGGIVCCPLGTITTVSIVCFAFLPLPSISELGIGCTMTPIVSRRLTRNWRIIFADCIILLLFSFIEKDFFIKQIVSRAHIRQLYIIYRDS